MPRPALTPDEIVRQRESIAEAALSLCETEAEGGLTLRALGKRIGLSPMGIYRYFPGGRAEVLAAVRAAGFREFAERLEDSVAGEGTPSARIRRLARSAVDFALERPMRYRLMFDLTQPEWESESEIASARRSAWRPVRRVFDEASEASEFAGDPESTAHAFVAAIHGAIAFELSDQPYEDRQVSKTLPRLVDALLAGFATT